jgi:transforming growth factor-beta-induced protein
MKNLIKAVALVAISFLAFSCSEDDKAITVAPTSITKLLKADITNSASAQFTSFVKALELTGLDAMLDGSGNYTVLAPTDDAFAGLLGGLTVQEFYDQDPAVLENILKYHIINSELLSKDLTEGQAISTSLGQDITVDLETNSYYPEIDTDLGAREQTSIYFNEARLFARDIKASNGRINVINTVLTPAGS